MRSRIRGMNRVLRCMSWNAEGEDQNKELAFRRVLRAPNYRNSICLDIKSAFPCHGLYMNELQMPTLYRKHTRKIQTPALSSTVIIYFQKVRKMFRTSHQPNPFVRVFRERPQRPPATRLHRCSSYQCHQSPRRSMSGRLQHQIANDQPGLPEGYHR